MEGSLGSTVSRVPGRRVSPALVTDSVWTGQMGLESASVIKVSLGPPVKAVRVGNMESTVIRVDIPQTINIT